MLMLSVITHDAGREPSWHISYNDQRPFSQHGSSLTQVLSILCVIIWSVVSSGGTPASSMSSSSIFRPRTASPLLRGQASPIPSSSALVNRLSEDRFTSRPLAAPCLAQHITAPYSMSTVHRQDHAEYQSSGQHCWNDYLDRAECGEAEPPIGPSEDDNMQPHSVRVQTLLQQRLNAHASRSDDVNSSLTTPPNQYDLGLEGFNTSEQGLSLTGEELSSCSGFPEASESHSS